MTPPRQFLVISQDSVDFLNSQYDLSVSFAHFRPNVVVATASGDRPHLEDDATRLMLATDVELRALRPCARCEMICIDPETGDRSRQPLRALGAYRRRGGQVLFGVLFSCEAGVGRVLRVGDPARIE